MDTSDNIVRTRMQRRCGAIDMIPIGRYYPQIIPEISSVKTIQLIQLQFIQLIQLIQNIQNIQGIQTIQIVIFPVINQLYFRPCWSPSQNSSGSGSRRNGRRPPISSSGCRMPISSWIRSWLSRMPPSSGRCVIFAQSRAMIGTSTICIRAGVQQVRQPRNRCCLCNYPRSSISYTVYAGVAGCRRVCAPGGKYRTGQTVSIAMWWSRWRPQYCTGRGCCRYSHCGRVDCRDLGSIGRICRRWNGF